ncbi:ribonuclease HI [Candidatus Hepatobacter penaei]|uniref:ribonuclease HI n=1 Tax=Candidatus Hepatobacter penaei TaxID=1274402 RepID=UPI0004F30AFE|nr:ribonuclease HI [Candidatus Hepatobacter penaei]TGW15827.1 ribonuclease HI [bacterium NHP-B]
MGLTIDIFTDGACLGNPGPGGWGAVIRRGEDEQVLSGAASQTTNNRMELVAVIEALRFLAPDQKITLYTDSQYVKNGITVWIKTWQRNGWKTSQKQPVKNQDLWQSLQEALTDHDVAWVWVKGHAGHPGNEHADRVAQEAAQRAFVEKLS